MWTYDISDDQALVLAECAAFYREALGETGASLEILEGLEVALPGSSNVQVELGHTAYRAGDLARGRGHLEQALELKAGNALAYAHLGVIELATGDREAAVRSWNAAIEIDTDPETAVLGAAGQFARARWRAEQAAQAASEGME